ncbi:MAG: hypothetical protein QXW57_04635, partial [Candidatus Micrarchaeaceae archaeon]
ELISFFIKENAVKGIVVSDSSPVVSRVYSNRYLLGEAFIAFSLEEALNNKVFIAKAEVNDRLAEYKLFVDDFNGIIAIAKLEPEEALAASRLPTEPRKLFFEEPVAEMLGLRDEQRIMLEPSPVWRRQG